MYTEIFVRAELSKDTPAPVIEMLRAIFNQEGDPCEIQTRHNFEHALFKTPRWFFIGSSCSFYHLPRPTSVMFCEQGRWYICSRSDFKNYNNEIELFWDWFRPWVCKPDAECIGWQWYEEDDMPTLVKTCPD